MEPSTTSDFQRNQQGILTKSQQKFLWWRFIGEFLFWTLFGTLFPFILFQQNWLWGLGALAIFAGLLLRTIYVYWPELLQPLAPKFSVGKIYKVQNRRAWKVAINDLSLNTNKALWLGLKSGEPYEIFYSEKSKWILSYQRVEENKQLNSEPSQKL